MRKNVQMVYARVVANTLPQGLAESWDSTFKRGNPVAVLVSAQRRRARVKARVLALVASSAAYASVFLFAWFEDILPKISPDSQVIAVTLTASMATLLLAVLYAIESMPFNGYELSVFERFCDTTAIFLERTNVPDNVLRYFEKRQLREEAGSILASISQQVHDAQDEERQADVPSAKALAAARGAFCWEEFQTVHADFVLAGLASAKWQEYHKAGRRLLNQLVREREAADGKENNEAQLAPVS